MTEHRPVWQDGGIHRPASPVECYFMLGESCPDRAPYHCECRALTDSWADKMDPWLFDMNGRVRRAYRTTYGQRLGRDVTVLLGVVAFCAIVWWAVWGVMA